MIVMMPVKYSLPLNVQFSSVSSTVSALTRCWLDDFVYCWKNVAQYIFIEGFQIDSPTKMLACNNVLVLHMIDALLDACIPVSVYTCIISIRKRQTAKSCCWKYV